ncbi:MAG: DUF6666 family protein [Pirellulaceae bacterium]
MFLPRTLTTCLRLCGTGLLACAVLTSSLDAQQPTSQRQGFGQPQQRAISGQYIPRYMRPAGQQVNDGAVTQETAPSTAPQTVQPGQQVQQLPQQLPMTRQQQYIPQGQMAPPYYQSGPVVGAPIDDVIVGDGYYGGGCGDPGCGGCGDCGGGCGCGPTGCFGECGCGPTIDPRDCCIADDCWLSGFSDLCCNSELFIGVHAFKNQVFQSRIIDDEEEFLNPENCHFGYHIGFNTGLPLYKVTCGLFSGQIGVRYSSSNLNDGVIDIGERNQTFVTGGFFRRVDYGLQFGLVADALREDWLPELDLVQVRSELSWVWGGSGSTFGLRAANNIQDDRGFIGGPFVPALNATTLDWYRIFYRHVGACGGYSEFFLGWTDERHTIIGADYDVPLGPRTALVTNFSYMDPDERLELTDNEAWNLSIGVTWRPRGTCWYKFYHRPLFNVADNSSMIISRNPNGVFGEGEGEVNP